MRVLGIDPGYDRLGLAVLEKEKGKEVIVHSSCIETNRKEELPERMRALGEEVEQVLDTYRPDCLAIETLFFNTNRNTAIAVAGIRGMVIYLAKKRGCRVVEYGPQEVKVAVTGYGKSDKQAVFTMLQKLIPDLPEGRLDDEYDAIALSVTCLAHASTTVPR